MRNLEISTATQPHKKIIGDGRLASIKMTVKRDYGIPIQLSLVVFWLGSRSTGSGVPVQLCNIESFGIADVQKAETALKRCLAESTDDCLQFHIKEANQTARICFDYAQKNKKMPQVCWNHIFGLNAC